ncbi:endolytic transglycosylase MltG [Edaphobacter albus]|uniref:endolytic transglycosylase MltG n=1 Tax=Edaphobacter sp. 4G125 TaxID=2763071 RepID=UPI00164954A4|nr:endolytic transglycosylase MltG [Edaphobacter sp. 4G125]QNI37068.1 endolytic transglycosylase MltG [Edaphobacter sp. 4G125]
MKFLVTLFLLVLLAAGAAYWFAYTPFGPSNETFVEITPHTGTQAMASQLQGAGIIRNRHAFELLRLVRGGTLKAGEYRFDHPAPMTEVYNRLVRGDIFTHALTIPEGYNIFDIAQAVQDAGLGQRDEFLQAERQHTELIAEWTTNAPHPPDSLEGYLFPDTYHFARHTSAVHILATMVRRFRQAAQQLNLQGDISRTVILASLVEKEVSQDAERPLVAGVFENRLEKSIPLATDPTVIYAAMLENRWRGTIHVSDLQSNSAYNTYRRAGLPPGPICNPGMAAFRAVLSPAKTDYLYFVSDAAGHSRFSATLKEHNQNVQAYRKARQR